MRYEVTIKRGAKKPEETTGIALKANRQEEAIAYALGIRKGISLVSERKIIVIIRDERGNKVYEKA